MASADHPRSGATYDFSHDKLRAVALEMVSPARRRQLHRDVAEAIAVELRNDIDAAAPQLAAHYDQAGMVEPAIDAYRVAGPGGGGVGLDEAVTMFRRALSLLAELPASPGRDALELDIRIALGSPLWPSRATAPRVRTNSTSEPCRFAASSATRGPTDSPRSRPRPAAGLPLRRFRELGQALLDHESHDPIARTEGRYLLGVSAFWRGDLAMARHYLDGAIDAYDVSIATSIWRCTPRTRRRCASYDWPGSSCGPEMPVGPTRRPICSRVGH